MRVPIINGLLWRTGFAVVALFIIAGCGPRPEPRGAALAEVSPQAGAVPRLSNLDLQTSELPEPAALQVYDIVGELYWPPEAEPAATKPAAPDPDAPDPGHCFPLHVYGKGVRVTIRRYRTLNGAEAKAFVDVWRHVEFVDSPGSMCHHPAYGFRCLDSHGRVTFETSVCWACGNFYLRRNDGNYHWYGLNSPAPGAQALKAYCAKIVNDRDSHIPGGVAAPPILNGPTIPYVPDALDAYESLNRDATDDDLAGLHDFTRLQSLGVFSPEVTDRGSATLKSLTGLRSLTLRTPRVADAGLECLRSLRQLREVSFIEMPVTDRTLASLADLTRLRSLYLARDGQDLVESPMRGVTDAGLVHLRRLTELRSLSLAGTGVTDAGLASLAHLSNLNDLQLSGTAVTGTGMEHLRGLTQLKELTIEHAAVTDEGLAAIARLPALEELFLEKDDAVTDAGVAYLARAPKLVRLNLQLTAITDAGLKHLIAAPNLGYLELRGTRITDAAIPILQAMPQLRAVWVGETQITDDGVARLQNARPQVTVQK